MLPGAKRFFWLAGLGLLAMSARAVDVLPGVPAPDLDAQFRRTSGWIGADAAYSIPLATNVTLWLFGDTFVGEIKDGRRTDAVMINNTLALQHGLDQVEYFHGKSRDGKPEAFFKPPDGRGYFWPMHGARTEDGLWLILHQIVNVKTGTPFGFKAVDCWLARIANPDEPPARWEIKYTRLPFTKIAPGSALTFGGAVMRDGDFIYIGGTDSRPATKQRFGHGGLVLARVPVQQLGDFKQWRFLAEGQWQKDFQKVTPLFADVASEFSLSYLPGAQCYVAVYMSGGIYGSIHVRFAPASEGPWSAPETVYRCPELDWPVQAFCYSAKAHPELASAPDELVITYAANSWKFSNLFSEPRLYWPRFVRVKVNAR